MALAEESQQRKSVDIERRSYQGTKKRKHREIDTNGYRAVVQQAEDTAISDQDTPAIKKCKKSKQKHKRSTKPPGSDSPDHKGDYGTAQCVGTRGLEIASPPGLRHSSSPTIAPVDTLRSEKERHKAEKKQQKADKEKKKAEKEKRKLDKDRQKREDKHRKADKRQKRIKNTDDDIEAAPLERLIAASSDPFAVLSSSTSSPKQVTASNSNNSPFYTQTSSLYLPIPPTSQSLRLALPCVVANDLIPLLLTYYHPLRGVILAFADPRLSSKKPAQESNLDHDDQINDKVEAMEHVDKTQAKSSREQNEDDKYQDFPSKEIRKSAILAHCAAEDDGSNRGALSYIWLTTTFLLFRPQRHDQLDGWLNVCSSGFIGLLCFNYFQISIDRDRIPPEWRWCVGGDASVPGALAPAEDIEEGRGMIGVARMARKGRKASKSHSPATPDPDSPDSCFVRPDGTKVCGSIPFRVVDCEVIPGRDRWTWSLHIEGTLLTVPDEARLRKREMEKEKERQVGGRAR